MNHTSIEWTHRPETGGAAGGFTWNPIRARLKNWQEIAAKDCDCPCEGCGTGAHCGVKVCDQPRNKVGTFCTHASPGCLNCYAEAIGKRFGTGLAFNVPNLEKIEFFIDEKILAEPLRRKKPATIFVGDMFDLFHEAISDAEISYVFAMMQDAKQHTFQVLTKRTARMREFVERWGAAESNIWLGTSVESQKYADERIPLLLQTPAAVRFLSVEPMLEAVDLENLPSVSGIGRYLCALSNAGVDPGADIPSKIDWVICGGESGPGARPFNLAWAESLQEQCKSAGVAFFMKQVGSWPVMPARMLDADGVFTYRFEQIAHEEHIALLDVTGKGGDPSEWPEHLRVREFPSEKLVTA